MDQTQLPSVFDLFRCCQDVAFHWILFAWLSVIVLRWHGQAQIPFLIRDSLARALEELVSRPRSTLTSARLSMEKAALEN